MRNPREPRYKKEIARLNRLWPGQFGTLSKEQLHRLAQGDDKGGW